MKLTEGETGALTGLATVERPPPQIRPFPV